MNQLALFRQLATYLSTNWPGLADKPLETPEATLDALWFYVTGQPKAVAHSLELQELPHLGEKELMHLHTLIAERLAGAPLAHITGRQSFMGIEMLSTPAALIPRKETELLGIAALEKAYSLATERGVLNIIDLCTGSGNIGLALAKLGPRCKIFGADLAAEAIHLAQQNAEYLELTSQVKFRVGNLFAPFDTEEFWGQVDLITCNPPYIPSAKIKELPAEIGDYEPTLAFDGGPFGLSILLRLLSESPRFLKPGSWLCFEVGLGQGEFIARKVSRNHHFTQLEIVRDQQGKIRVVLAQNKGQLL